MGYASNDKSVLLWECATTVISNVITKWGWTEHRGNHLNILWWKLCSTIVNVYRVADSKSCSLGFHALRNAGQGVVSAVIIRTVRLCLKRTRNPISPCISHLTWFEMRPLTSKRWPFYTKIPKYQIIQIHQKWTKNGGGGMCVRELNFSAIRPPWGS